VAEYLDSQPDLIRDPSLLEHEGRRLHNRVRAKKVCVLENDPQRIIYYRKFLGKYETQTILFFFPMSMDADPHGLHHQGHRMRP